MIWLAIVGTIIFLAAVAAAIYTIWEEGDVLVSIAIFIVVLIGGGIVVAAVFGLVQLWIEALS